MKNFLVFVCSFSGWEIQKGMNYFRFNNEFNSFVKKQSYIIYAVASKCIKDAM